MYTFGVALAPPPPMLSSAPSMLLSAPSMFFFQICALQQYLYACNVRDSCFRWLRASTYVNFHVRQVFPRFGIHDYGIQMLQILLSEHPFSWPVQRLSLLMSNLFYFIIFFSVPQNKVAEIRGEKIGVGRLARSASLGPSNHFHKLTPLARYVGSSNIPAPNCVD